MGISGVGGVRLWVRFRLKAGFIWEFPKRGDPDIVP